MTIAEREPAAEDAVRQALRSSTPEESARSASRIARRGWLVRRALLLADIVGLTCAFLVAESVVGPAVDGADRFTQLQEVVFFVATLPCWIIVAKLYGLYDRDDDRADHSTADDLFGVFHVLTVGAWLLYALASLTGIAGLNLLKVFTFWLLGTVFVAGARGAARTICRRRPEYVQNTLIVGAGDVGQVIARKLGQHPEYGIKLVGFIDAEPRTRRPDLDTLTILGVPDDLPELIRSYEIERVIISFSTDSHERTLDLMRLLKDFDVRVDVVPRLFELLPPSAEIHTIEGLSLIGLPRLHMSRSSLLIKRTTDVALSLTGLIFLAPFLLAIAAAIKIETRGPVFFRQVRMGAAGKPFRIFKFRTMVADAEDRKAAFAHLNRHLQNGGDPRMFKIANDPRVTRFGRVLRRYSLDELPQLFDVLRGEMSLVGPRPLILDEDLHVHDWGRDRLQLKPGVTGLWQVLGRDAIPFEEMLRLDYLYVTTWSLWKDLSLLIRTGPAVLRGETRLAPGANPTPWLESDPVGDLLVDLSVRRSPVVVQARRPRADQPTA